ncbi:thioester-containing protein 1 allele S3-like [Anopheles moucheti]|uniref:thioester-containing protein 1 allele S3-like n=1 Tax=Anopheles moucheti TaxID=186751 RepID=UPI0022F07C99|nr:thioester-containing protein 1 allele S3-like [Anopheles moucheti]
MWQFIRLRILTLIIFISATQGILVVGPDFILANQEYTVVVSNFNSNMSKVDLRLRMDGHTINGSSALNLTKTVDVQRYTNRMITFKVPADLSAGTYKLTIDGQHGFGYHKEVALVYLVRSISGLIQLDKPVYKPGDTVKFHVIVLDTELKPPARVNAVHVTMRDPLNKVIREWTSAKLYAGVFESNLRIATTSPEPGLWKMSVQVDGAELVSRTFEVKEYVFDVEVIPSGIPLMEHQALNLTIAAYYQTYRKPVKGLAKVELYLEDDRLDQQKVVEVYGLHQVELSFLELFDPEDQKDVLVKTTFIEQHTNRSVVKETHITVYKYKYRVDLIKDIPHFYPGHPFKCALQFRYHDGTPAKGIAGEVIILDIEYEKTVTSDDNGLIKLELNPGNSTQEMVITFENDDGFYFFEQVYRIGGVSNAYIKLELKSPIKLNNLLQFVVTCNEPMTFFVYYIVKKGNIIDSGFITTNEQNKYPLRFTASEKMIPQFKIIVIATVANDRMMFDFLDLDFEEPHYNIRFNLNKQEVKPGQQIELSLSGQRGTYVGLVAHNKGLMYDKDLFSEDIMRVYNGFLPTMENELDKLHSVGQFFSTFDGIMFNEATHNDQHQTNNAISKTVSYRADTPESWLWQNVTIGRFGTHKMIETVPDMMTSWYLTGFSIHPEYGLGIIQQPVQLTAIQPFYIVENLPRSIKRGETVQLQFTLFNWLAEGYTATVTLYNVDNQTEFVGQPADAQSCTKSVHVRAKVGVPVAFLVKARILGEMTVRIKASISPAQATVSSYEVKVIRVMPESLVQSREVSRFFSFDTYQNKTFRLNLDVPKTADNGTSKIKVQLHTNLYTGVIGNDRLDKLLVVERNERSDRRKDEIRQYVQIIMVLDYLHAIGSKDQHLIDKATNLARQGYQRLLRYRRYRGYFAIRKNFVASEFLTVFIAKALETASKYITEIDVLIAEKAYDWIAEEQQSFPDDGSFLLSPEDGIQLTSYVVTALLENENARVRHAAVIQRAMRYLSEAVETIDNPCDLSYVTYALMMYGHSMKDKAFERLVNMSNTTNNGTEWHCDRQTDEIEGTSYALLSFLIAEKYEEAIPIIRRLYKFNRYDTTLIRLKALTKLEEKMSRNDYIIQLKHFCSKSSSTSSTKQIRPKSSGIDFKEIPNDTGCLEVNVAGIGFGLLKVYYQYSVNLVNFDKRFKLDLEKQSTGSYELRLQVCANFIPKLTGSRSSLTLIEVTFPSGYDVDRNPISKQTTTNPIQHTEIRYGGLSVVVYYNSMGTERNCFTVTAYRRRTVAMKRPAYVIARDYYDPNLTALETYE